VAPSHSVPFSWSCEPPQGVLAAASAFDYMFMLHHTGLRSLAWPELGDCFSDEREARTKRAAWRDALSGAGEVSCRYGFSPYR
jgi:hypothetical protein